MRLFLDRCTIFPSSGRRYLPYSTTIISLTLPSHNALQILPTILSFAATIKDMDINLTVYRTPSGDFYCPTCNLTLNSEDQFKTHLKSKGHMKKYSQKQRGNSTDSANVWDENSEKQASLEFTAGLVINGIMINSFTSSLYITFWNVLMLT